MHVFSDDSKPPEYRYEEPDRLSETRGPLRKAIDRLLLLLVCMYAIGLILWIASVAVIILALSK